MCRHPRILGGNGGIGLSHPSGCPHRKQRWRSDSASMSGVEINHADETGPGSILGAQPRAKNNLATSSPRELDPDFSKIALRWSCTV